MAITVSLKFKNEVSVSWDDESEKEYASDFLEEIKEYAYDLSKAIENGYAEGSIRFQSSCQDEGEFLRTTKIKGSADIWDLREYDKNMEELFYREWRAEKE